jgi:hypothetical protein
LNSAAARGDKVMRVDRACAIAGDTAMPLLLLGLVIGAVLVMLYKSNSSGGARIFNGGETYILIDDGTLRLRKGWVPARALSTLADLLRDAGVSQGHITLSPDRRVAVSWHVPPALHQQIRNVLLSEV